MSKPTLAVTLAERTFGAETSEDEKFQDVLPTIEMFRELRMSLRQASALLALTHRPGMQKPEIYAAYQQDLKLLDGRRLEFEKAVKMALRCSIIKRVAGDGKRTEPDLAWEKLTEQLPRIAREPLLHLTHVRAAKDVPELLKELKDDFELGVVQLLRGFAYWLQILVEQDYIGLVEWSALDIGRYHFFRYELVEEVLHDTERGETIVDTTQPLGRQTTYTTYYDRKVRRTRFRERHDHHIVNGKIHALTDYPNRVPCFVAEFLDNVPAQLRDHLMIVSGVITTEEKLRWMEETEVIESSGIVATYKGSPAVALGPFALLGWSADDMRNVQDVKYYAGQPAGAAAWKVRTQECVHGVVFGTIGVLAVVGFAALGIYHLDVSDKEDANRTHAADIGPYAGRVLYAAPMASPLPLPVKLSDQREVRMIGFRPNNNATTSLFFSYGSSSTHDGTRVNTGEALLKGSPPHGAVDLGDLFGVPVRLYVFSAGKNGVSYYAVPK